MQFFNNDLAVTLQYFTFPLEMVGITLATIEVRFGKLTEKINNLLTIQVSNWERAKTALKKRHPLLYKFNGGDMYFNIPMPGPMYIVFAGLVIVLLAFAVLTGLVFLLTELGYVDKTTVAPVFDVSLGFYYAVYVPFAGCTIVVLGFVLFAVKFVTNRAVGTLGIIIAGLGVLGEAYQFATQLIS
ncbi:MAG: hypothetical protein O7F71_19695 [Gammaproteobacteria bacterium]|nr:hypothetical protein [Gammaproteobacteria bacterium]